MDAKHKTVNAAKITQNKRLRRESNASYKKMRTEKIDVNENINDMTQTILTVKQIRSLCLHSLYGTSGAWRAENLQLKMLKLKLNMSLCVRFHTGRGDVKRAVKEKKNKNKIIALSSTEICWRFWTSALARFQPE